MPVPKWVVSSSTVRILQNRICLSTACHLGPRVPIYQPGVRSALDTAGATRRSPARCPVVECQNRWYFETSRNTHELMRPQPRTTKLTRPPPISVTLQFLPDRRLRTSV